MTNPLCINTSLRLTLFTAAALGAAIACTDSRELPTGRAPRGAIGQPGYTLLPAGTKLACPPGQGFTSRSVTAGGGADANGNGKVCDRKVGPLTDERTITLDDIIVPVGLLDIPAPAPPRTP